MDDALHCHDCSGEVSAVKLRPGRWAVLCDGPCRARGPRKKTRREAEHAWRAMQFGLATWPARDAEDAR